MALWEGWKVKYVISKDCEIFLVKNQDLVSSLNVIENKIKEYFRDARLYLELVCDPETSKESVFLAIKTKMGMDEAIEALDKFDTEWWNGNNIHQKICIDVMLS